MAVTLGHNQYGKAETRMVRVTRDGDRHELKDLNVGVTLSGDLVEVTVSDDGCGFDPADPRPGHLGLHTMRERAEAVGGSLELHAQPSAGTIVRCRVPVPRGSAASPAAG